MKRFLVLLLLGFSVIDALSQSITAAEYFLDIDPGAGNGTAITIGTSNETINFTASVPVGSLSAGFHLAGIRVRDANGIWSQFEIRGFYVSALPVDAANIITAEYFFDTDPGAGNGTAVSIGASGANLNFAAAIPTSLTAGFHLLGIRTKDADGKWSLFERRGFYIRSAGIDLPDITAAEYFIDTDPGVGNGTTIAIPTPVSTYTDSLLLPLGNLPLGNYRIAIRVKNTSGQWSLLENRAFSVCTTYGAQSEMSYQVEGNRVFFTNNSLYYDTVSWKFGDNTLDTVIHPIKTYANAGIYSVQLITGNSCGIDTLTEAIEIRGLQRVNPGHAGNGGVSTLVFEGFGFSPTTDVKLILGAQVFTPVVKFFVNSTRIRAHFDLTGFTPGVYKAVATIGGSFDTLSNALTIEAAVPTTLTLDIANGRRVERTGRVKVDGFIRNNGSHDAIMVPYVTAASVIPGITPVNMNISTNTLGVNLSTEGVFQQTLQYLNGNNVPLTVMNMNDLDSARQLQIVAYYRTRVPGNSSKRELIGFPHNGSAHSYKTASVVLGPLLDSYALLDSIRTDHTACYSTFLKREVIKQLNIPINDVAWNNCFSNAFDTLMKTLANIVQNPIYEDYAVPMQAGFSALLAEMVQCGGTGVPSNLGGIQFKRIIQGVMNNWLFLTDIDSLDTDCIDTTVKVFARMAFNQRAIKNSNGRITNGGNCSECPGAQVFPELCDMCLPFIMAGKVGAKLKVNGHAWGSNSAVQGCQEWCESSAVDPNVKYGPGDNDGRKYINHLKSVNFKINFENLSTATAPAAYVEIRDTIDRSVFDISTFSLGAFSWGDSLISSEPNEQNVSMLKNIKPFHPNFLRIDATTDTSTGVVTWKFWTVDTVTLQLTTDPTHGFLPPNTDGVKGAGFVTYSIAPLPTVTNGTILKNKASIIFDANAPIVTNEWEYRIDTLQPSSSVNNLPAVTNTESFTVNWAGTDAHSGVDLFSVYVSINDSVYKVWQSLTDQTSAVYNGEFGKTYKFFSIALDKATNYEDPPGDALNNPDAITSLGAALPLDLLSFIAVKTADKKIELKWLTANEKNVSHFELQRSADGAIYTPISNIPARNNMTGGSYSWVDNAPLQKINYYRLKIIDVDGSFKFSPVRIVRIESENNILVFPTATNDLVFLQSNSEVVADLLNVQGVRLQQKTIKGNSSFDLSNLAKGVYFIRIHDVQKTFKVIKQ